MVWLLCPCWRVEVEVRRRSSEIGAVVDMTCHRDPPLPRVRKERCVELANIDCFIPERGR